MKKYFTKLFCIIIIASSSSLAQFWNAGEGPYGGTILDFAFNSQGHIYGAGFFGLYRSLDDGQNWEPVGAQFLSSFFQLNTIAIDQMDNIYVGTVSGIIKSTDNGLTWNAANNGLTNLNINTIEINSSGVLFAGSFLDAARSTDGGANWTPITNGMQQNTGVLDFVIDESTNEIFAGTTSGVYSSTNNGDNWTNISSGLPGGTAVTAVDLSPEESPGGNYLFVGTTQGVYRYDRLLQTWLHLAAGLGTVYIYALLVNFQGDIFAATANGIFRHLAAATQWTQLNVALIFSFVTALAITQQGYILAGEDWGGPLISMNNGNNWIRILTGLTAYGIVSFYYAHLLNKFFIGTDAGFFAGLAALTGWQLLYPQGNPFFFVTATAYSVLGFLFAATYFQGIYRSSDEGATWQAVNNGLTNFFVTALVVTALGHLYAATQGGGVYFSDNNGDSWTQINSGLTSLLITTLYLTAAGVLYAGTIDSGIFSLNFSTNQWTQLTITGLTTLYITSILVNSLGDMFAGTFGGGIFKLASGATSWVALGIAVTLIYDMILRHSQTRGAEEIYAGTPEGVFYSADDGSTWNQINSGLGGNLSAVNFATDSDGEVYVAVNGGGIFKGGGTTHVELIDNKIPDNYFLKQNYPNPFNPATTISFDLPSESFVSLEIFNSIGEKVAVLVSENLSAGKYNYNWNAGSLPSGVYFYRLSSENFMQTKKLMIMR